MHIETKTQTIFGGFQLPKAHVNVPIYYDVVAECSNKCDLFIDLFRDVPKSDALVAC
jgi:hypothetical protein